MYTPPSGPCSAVVKKLEEDLIRAEAAEDQARAALAEARAAVDEIRGWLALAEHMRGRDGWAEPG